MVFDGVRSHVSPPLSQQVGQLTSATARSSSCVPSRLPYGKAPRDLALKQGETGFGMSVCSRERKPKNEAADTRDKFSDTH